MLIISFPVSSAVEDIIHILRSGRAKNSKKKCRNHIKFGSCFFFIRHMTNIFTGKDNLKSSMTIHRMANYMAIHSSGGFWACLQP